MDTIAEHKAKAAEREERDRRRLKIMREAIAELPDHLPMPTISNESEAGGLSPFAWLSFSRHYGETWQGAQVLAALEAEGFRPQPSSIVKWDDYRHSPEPAPCDELPETKGRYKLTDCAPLFPLWLETNPHTGCKAVAFYRSPAGLLLRVSVPGPASFYAYAQRKEHVGGWCYLTGTAAPRFPQAFHDAANMGGLQIECHTRAHLLPPQGLDAVLYFEPIEEIPSATPATLLAALAACVANPEASR